VSRQDIAPRTRISHSIIIGKRLGKDILSETNDIIKQYSNTLDGLMQQFRDQVDRDVAVFIRRTGKDPDTLRSFHSLTPSQAIPWISGISLMQRV
jgi:hypothetical protein